MRREEFELEVEDKAPPHLRGSDYLRAAIYDFVRRGGPFYPLDLSTVVQDADKRYERSSSSRGGTVPRRSPRPRPGAEAHFISRMLVEHLRLWTEGLRQEGFDGTEPPYPNDEGAAADYIEKTSADDLTHWTEVRRDDEGDRERIYQLARQLGLDVTTKARFLPYGRPGDEHRKSAPVSPDTFLFKLAGEIERVSKRTGLPPEALTAHIFTGVMPLMSRVRTTEHRNYVHLPSGEQAHLRSVTLTFRTADLTFEELRRIYDGIKIYMGGKGVQAPTPEDLEFWQLVEETGGPPEPYNGVKDFWREVLGRWNQEHPGYAPLKSWEGLQKRYRRICKRLGIE